MNVGSLVEQESMNRELLWWFMDVQTRLNTPVCPHYSEHVWKNILKEDGFVVNAGWPLYDAPDPTLKIANKYLQDSIVLLRKLLRKQVSGPKKAKKGDTIPAAEENILTEILEALKQGVIGQDLNFKQIQKHCMPFLTFKKDEALSVGQIQVLRENSDLIKRQLGLEHVEVLSASDEVARSKAGSCISLQNSESPFTWQSCCHLFEQNSELEPKQAPWKLFSGNDCCRPDCPGLGTVSFAGYKTEPNRANIASTDPCS
ncbi:leucyl-tRNA synthetase [Musa troglodytarum]|uniref:Leucyl-tRNA synthetase n=1 Tax=Musa troglodytarum TaxID=320322 RepID=A0A9E7EQQ7_9LILI|nr:leucyl-tRNA synthetase [Musa troglodytarum]